MIDSLFRVGGFWVPPTPDNHPHKKHRQIVVWDSSRRHRVHKRGQYPEIDPEPLWILPRESHAQCERKERSK